MPNDQNGKRVYDLEDRTFEFAKSVRLFVKMLPKHKLTLKTENNSLKPPVLLAQIIGKRTKH